MATRVRRESIYSSEKLFVDACLWTNGNLTIEGQDLSLDLGEYEYFLTVEAEAFPRLLESLGAAPGDDVLAVLKASGDDFVHAGERHWLICHEIPYEFFSPS